MIKTKYGTRPTHNILKSIEILLLAFIIIYTSGYAMSTVETSIGAYVLIIPTFIMLVILLVKQKVFLKIDIFTFSYLILCLMVIVSFIVNFNFPYFSTNIKTLLILTFAFCLARLIKFEDFIKYFTLSMKCIVIISLIIYIWINYLNLPFNLPVVYNINGAAYYNGIFFFVFVFSTLRNTGVFWEPGLFASFIIISMIFEISFKKNISYFNLLILFLGLLSTQSTAGYFFLPMILLLLLNKNAKFGRSYFFSALFIIIALLAYINMGNILHYLWTLNPDVFGKIINQEGSYVDRLDSPITNLSIFLSYPIFGAGIGNINYIYGGLTDIYQTSTSTYFLAAFGFWGVLYTLFWVYGIMKLRNQNNLSKIIIISIFLMILNKEPHTSIVVTYCIMFFFLKEAFISKSNNLTGSIK
ncbi:hypothetical protein [Chengkuizengella axinellae]|uniref:O-antigen ligase domain-containing protein n=1 Tax=Chengkuizengella axinellae TaxID=3064388 RepID=A0ABT9IZD1_9BACL|nr:hypothetical protein [Chengkuizengella sp. 2205SS18-9]MDP5274735.1 hypothetical protein [Chengkuizengella sp. 2205SS18-9]